MRPSIKCTALALAVLAGAGAWLHVPDVRAQDLPEPGDGFTWQQVGDRGLDVEGLAFGSDSTLWATGTRGPYRLDTTGGFPGRWIFLSDYPVVGSLLVLGRGPQGDTLVTGLGDTQRSVDGGLTWEVVHDRGGGGLYEIPAGLPHAGRILTGALSAIAYSDDRGASFTPSVVPGQPGAYGGAEGFVALPPNSSHPGRILAAGAWGVNVSDDGGATFRGSGLWQAVYYFGHALDAVERLGLVEFAGGGAGAVMAGRVSGLSGASVWSSADEGETWQPDGLGQQLFEGPPNGGRPRAVLALGGASVLVVLRGGTVYRSDDAGMAWAPVGRAPEISTFITVASAVLGPDRRLYVGLVDTSAEEGWVWRTKETHDPAPVSNEPPPASGEPLGVEVAPNPVRGTAAVALTLAQPGAVSASVYDVLGRRVAVLHEGPLAAGRHEMDIEAGLPPGVYVVRVVAGDTMASHTVTVLR